MSLLDASDEELIRQARKIGDAQGSEAHAILTVRLTHELREASRSSRFHGRVMIALTVALLILTVALVILTEKL